MDQETLINLVLVFFFLIITTLVRGLKARQQRKVLKKKKQAAKPSVFSFFQKIRDQVQESLQEQERQARQHRQQQQPETESSDPTFWDELSEDEMIQEEREIPSAPEKARASTWNQTEDPIQKMAPEFQVQDREIKTRRSSEEVPPPTLHPYGRRPNLRQAVVWAEIIDKPVALRKNPNDSIL